MDPIGAGAMVSGRLEDQRAKQELLERILRRSEADAGAGRSWWPHLAVAGTTAAVLVAAGFGVTTALEGTGSGGPEAPAPPVAGPTLGASPTATAASLPQPGGPVTDCFGNLGGPSATPDPSSARPTFALDGTVVEIAPPAERGLVAEVTLQVEEWFLGGNDGEVTLDMYTAEPMPGGSIEYGTYRAGTRLLVSGRGDYVYYCGHTRTYSAGEAERWRRIFG